MTSRILLISSMCAILLMSCSAKPTEVLSNGFLSLNPLQQQLITAVETDAKRQQRSPQFGFPEGGFGDGGFPGPGLDPFANYDDRRYEYHHKRHHKQHHKPEGCRVYDCGGAGYEPLPPLYPGGASESIAQASAGSNGGPFGGGSEAQASAGSNGKPFGGGSGAQASAGSLGIDGPYGGAGGSQANAQSASFNFGPVSASFSLAESSSGGQRF